MPEWHPQHGSFQPFPVFVWVIRHPELTVLVDTGIGTGDELIDDWYQPTVTPLADALASADLQVTDIDAVVVSHLHFDHCGQQRDVPAPVWVQQSELDTAAAQPRYTIAAWADIGTERCRAVDGGHRLVAGIDLVPTPGHTPGHQSVVVETVEGTVVLGGQCAFTHDELASGEPAPTNLHGPDWRDPARSSLERITSLAPLEVLLSHDDTRGRPPSRTRRPTLGQ